MRVTAIAVLDEARGIGKDGRLPWHIPADMKRFKELTMGHPIIMGRKTFVSIGRALPGRKNIIITRDLSFRAEGCTVTHSLDEALDATSGADAFIIGGAEIYALALPKTDRLELTLVSGTHDVDAFFPSYDDFSAVQEEDHPDEQPAYRFVTLERKAKSR